MYLSNQKPLNFMFIEKKKIIFDKIIFIRVERG